jgi:hypothetical protein
MLWKLAPFDGVTTVEVAVDEMFSVLNFRFFDILVHMMVIDTGSPLIICNLTTLDFLLFVFKKESL